MAKLKRKLGKADLDLNNDGVFDEKDKKIAGKVLASKIDKKEVKDIEAEKVGSEEEQEKAEEVKDEELKEGNVAVVDISRKYRSGSVVPEEQIAEWKKCGIDYEQWF